MRNGIIVSLNKKRSRQDWGLRVRLLASQSCYDPFGIEEQLQCFFGRADAKVALGQKGRIEAFPIHDSHGKSSMGKHGKIVAAVADAGTAVRTQFLKFCKFLRSSI